MAAANTLQNLQEEATCPICLGHFKDPVITPCGHNFCRACIEGCLDGGPAAARYCPQCRGLCSRVELRPNRQLQSILELVRQLSVQLETPPRGEGLCEQHEEKLKLFCQDDHKLICVICQVSREHEKHRVRPINEAAKEYQGKLENWLPTLKKERAAISVSKQKEEEEYEALRKKLKAQKVTIATEMERLRQTLREQEQTIRKRLEEMDMKITLVENANLAKLSSEISSLDALIKEIETKCKQPPEELLKTVGLTLSRCENMRFHEPEQKIKKDRKKGTMKNIPDLETYYYERAADIFLNENILNSTDLKRYKEQRPICKGVIPHPVAREQQENSKVYADSSVYEFHHGNLAVVTLDSETAHKSLVLSENLKRVTYSPQYNQYRPQLHRLCDPKRFTASPCVLGRECFISRRHYWEVQLLQEGLGWTVGVARESVNRNLFTQTPQEQPVNQRFSPHFSSGYVQMVPTESQQEGIWAVRKNNNRYFASTSPCTVLNPREPPKKLGVYLDYEGRRVSLYNGDTMAELHTFSGASFKGKLYPYFNLHGIIDAGLMRIEATDLRLV